MKTAAFVVIHPKIVQASNDNATNLSPQKAARLIAKKCSFYLDAIAPLSSNVLLWRGASVPTELSCTISSPPYDLLDNDTYGALGAEFFRAMESSALAAAAPSRSHIAVGSRRVAAQWGLPIAVWPIGRFSYTYIQNRALIYDEDETFERVTTTHGLLTNNVGLRDAVRAGKEIMFDATSYIAVPHRHNSQVVQALRHILLETTQ